MIVTNIRLRTAEDRNLSEAGNAGDSRLQHVSSVAITSLQNAEALYLIAYYLIGVLEAQALVNQQLLAHINLIATKPIPSATIGEIVKSGLDQLVKEAEEKARKLPRSLYT